MIKKTIILITVFFALLSQYTYTFASNISIGIKPLRTEILLNPGEEKEFSLELSNNSDNDIKAKAILENIFETDEKGYPISSSAKDKDTPQDLDITKWITLPSEIVEIKAKSKEKVDIKIKAPQDATPGGRYAVIYYEPIINNNQGLQIKTQIASLILLTIAGEVKKSGYIEDFSIDTKNYIYGEPLNFNIKFKNDGNVHLKPTGKIIIKNSDSQELKSISKYKDINQGNLEKISDFIPININQGNVLPNTSRIFVASFNQNYENIKGKFKAILELNYADKTEKKEIEFNIDPKVEIKKFDVSILNDKKYINLEIENIGNVPINLEGSINFYNSLNFMINQINFSGNTLLPNQKDKKEILLDKDLPKDNYIIKVELKNKNIEIIGKNEYILNTKESFFESILHGDVQNITILALSITLIILLTYNFLLKKNK